MEEEKLYLCFIKLIGLNSNKDYMYDFYFTDNTENFWGDNFEQKPAGLCNNLEPFEEAFTTIKRTTTKFLLDLAQEQTCLSMQDVIDGCCALGWENIDNTEYPEDGRIIFQFGEDFDNVENKLARRGSFFLS